MTGKVTRWYNLQLFLVERMLLLGREACIMPPRDWRNIPEVWGQTSLPFYRLKSQAGISFADVESQWRTKKAASESMRLLKG